MFTHIISGWYLDVYAYSASHEGSFFEGWQNLVELRADSMDAEGYEDVANAAEQLFRDEFGAASEYRGVVFEIVEVPDDVGECTPAGDELVLLVGELHKDV